MSNKLAVYDRDYARALSKDGETLLLLDFSGSMYERHSGGKTRYECLVESIKVAGLGDCPAITFGEGGMRHLFRMHGDRLPKHAGLNIVAEAQEPGTPMSEAIDLALRRRRRPKVVFLISDGEPLDSPDGGWDSKQSAFERALKLKCPVNTVFIGDDPEAEAFMGAIARATGGYFQNVKDRPIQGRSLTDQLADAMSAALPALPALPART